MGLISRLNLDRLFSFNALSNWFAKLTILYCVQRTVCFNKKNMLLRWSCVGLRHISSASWWLCNIYCLLQRTASSRQRNFSRLLRRTKTRWCCHLVNLMWSVASLLSVLPPCGPSEVTRRPKIQSFISCTEALKRYTIDCRYRFHRPTCK